MIKDQIEGIKNNPNRRNRWVIGIVFAIIAGFIIFSDHGVLTRFSLERQKISLKNKIEEEHRKKEVINSQIKHLQSDTLEIERIAREKYGMVKPGEEVFHISTSKK